jgi:hypothetical protein
MGTTTMMDGLWDKPYIGQQLKTTFGNRKNYRRYAEYVKYDCWLDWLISLGYRDNK